MGAKRGTKEPRIDAIGWTRARRREHEGVHGDGRAVTGPVQGKPKERQGKAAGGDPWARKEPANDRKAKGSRSNPRAIDVV